VIKKILDSWGSTAIKDVSASPVTVGRFPRRWESTDAIAGMPLASTAAPFDALDFLERR